MKWYWIGVLLFLVFSIALATLLDGLRAFIKRHALERSKKPLKLKVAARVDYTDSIFTLTLKPAFWQTLPVFQAGQFLSIRLPIGQTQKIVSRRYSLAQWHAKPKSYHLGIRAVEDGLVSNWLHKNALPNAWIEALRPSGHFYFKPPTSTDTHIIFIAAGIGITPIAAMIQQLQSGYPAYKTTLFHTARDANALIDAEKYTHLAENTAWFNYQAFVTNPEPAKTRSPHLNTSRISAAQILANVPNKTHCDIYMCASLPMMQTFEAYFIAQGLLPTQIHWESFGSTASTHDHAQFPVTVNQTEFLFEGQPTLLHALEEWGVSIEADCRAGDCGACQFTLIEGECHQIQRPQIVLSHQKRLACCVIPQSTIKIAL